MEYSNGRLLDDEGNEVGVVEAFDFQSVFNELCREGGVSIPMEGSEFQSQLHELFHAEIEAGSVRILPSHPEAELMVEPETLEEAKAVIAKLRAALEKSRKVAAGNGTQLEKLRHEMPRLQNCRARLREVLSLFVVCDEGYARTAYVSNEDLEVWRRDAEL